MTTTIETVVPPHQILWGLAQAVVPSRALHLVAELGIADQLGEKPSDAEELAKRCGVDADALLRVLRLLSAHGVFRVDGSTIAHNETSQLLRADHPASMRGFARLNSLQIAWDSIRALDGALRSGRTGAESVHPGGFFGYLADHPDEAAVFGEAMTGKARADIDDVLGAYDFSRFASIADIGGGRGHLLTAILQTSPAASGVLFDLPDVVRSARVDTGRIRLHAGDFFTDPLPAADAYLLMEIIHDWSDDEAVQILRAVRRAAPAGSAVLILEHVAPDAGVDLVSATLDVLMLAVTGGRERSPAQLNDLFEQAGLTPTKLTRTKGPIAIVEAAA